MLPHFGRRELFAILLLCSAMSADVVEAQPQPSWAIAIKPSALLTSASAGGQSAPTDLARSIENYRLVQNVKTVHLEVPCTDSPYTSADLISRVFVSAQEVARTSGTLIANQIDSSAIYETAAFHLKVSVRCMRGMDRRPGDFLVNATCAQQCGPFALVMRQGSRDKLVAGILVAPTANARVVRQTGITNAGAEVEHLIKQVWLNKKLASDAKYSCNSALPLHPTTSVRQGVVTTGKFVKATSAKAQDCVQPIEGQPGQILMARVKGSKPPGASVAIKCGANGASKTLDSVVVCDTAGELMTVDITQALPSGAGTTQNSTVVEWIMLDKAQLAGIDAFCASASPTTRRSTFAALRLFAEDAVATLMAPTSVCYSQMPVASGRRSTEMVLTFWADGSDVYRDSCETNWVGKKQDLPVDAAGDATTCDSMSYNLFHSAGHCCESYKGCVTDLYRHVSTETGTETINMWCVDAPPPPPPPPPCGDECLAMSVSNGCNPLTLPFSALGGWFYVTTRAAAHLADSSIEGDVADPGTGKVRHAGQLMAWIWECQQQDGNWIPVNKGSSCDSIEIDKVPTWIGQYADGESACMSHDGPGSTPSLLQKYMACKYSCDAMTCMKLGKSEISIAQGLQQIAGVTRPRFKKETRDAESRLDQVETYLQSSLAGEFEDVMGAAAHLELQRDSSSRNGKYAAFDRCYTSHGFTGSTVGKDVFTLLLDDPLTDVAAHVATRQCIGQLVDALRAKIVADINTLTTKKVRNAPTFQPAALTRIQYQPGIAAGFFMVCGCMPNSMGSGLTGLATTPGTIDTSSTVKDATKRCDTTTQTEMCASSNEFDLMMSILRPRSDTDNVPHFVDAKALVVTEMIDASVASDWMATISADPATGDRRSASDTQSSDGIMSNDGVVQILHCPATYDPSVQPSGGFQACWDGHFTGKYYMNGESPPCCSTFPASPAKITDAGATRCVNGVVVHGTDGCSAYPASMTYGVNQNGKLEKYTMKCLSKSGTTKPHECPPAQSANSLQITLVEHTNKAACSSNLGACGCSMLRSAFHSLGAYVVVGNNTQPAATCCNAG